jgi:hypothetical protein
MNRPAQLQVNQSGAWRSCINFDAGDVPDEFLQSADQLARLSGTQIGMRIVVAITTGSGPIVAMRNVLMHWTRETGWRKA